ncbi:MAG TPA: hypothetical protein VF649_12290 [Sphingomonas sp.]
MTAIPVAGAKTAIAGGAMPSAAPGAGALGLDFGAMLAGATPIDAAAPVAVIMPGPEAEPELAAVAVPTALRVAKPGEEIAAPVPAPTLPLPADHGPHARRAAAPPAIFVVKDVAATPPAAPDQPPVAAVPGVRANKALVPELPVIARDSAEPEIALGPVEQSLKAGAVAARPTPHTALAAIPTIMTEPRDAASAAEPSKAEEDSAPAPDAAMAGDATIAPMSPMPMPMPAAPPVATRAAEPDHAPAADPIQRQMAMANGALPKGGDVKSRLSAAPLRNASVPPQQVQQVTSLPGFVAVPGPDMQAAVVAPLTQPSNGGMPPAMAMMQDVSALLAQVPPVATANPAQALALPQAVGSTSTAAPVTASAAELTPGAVREPKRREAGRSNEAVSPITGDGPTMLVADVAPPVSMRDAAPVTPAAVHDVVRTGVISPDAAVGFHVDAARHGQELDQVARDIVSTAGNDGKLSFKLDSHRLGSLGVEMTRDAIGLHVRLESGDAATRSLIADQQQQLVTDARAVGVRIAETTVEAPRVEPPRREEPAQSQGGTTNRNDSPSGQSTQGQSTGGQPGQRGSGQQAQTAPGWTQQGRGTGTGAGTRTGRPAATPRDLYA